MEGRGTVRCRAARPVVDGVPGSAARYARVAGHGRQPEPQGRAGTPAGGAGADADRQGRLPADPDRPRGRDPLAGLGERARLTAGKPTVGNDFIVGGDLSYEFDLFGRVRNTVAGARAGEQATAGDVAVLDLNLHAELAADYFMLRGLDAQQELLDHTVADYAKALRLTENLYHGGAAAVSDVDQAKAQLESAKTRRRTPGCAVRRRSMRSRCWSASRRAHSGWSQRR